MPRSHTSFFMVDIDGTELSEIEREILKQPHVGSVILFTRNFVNPAQLETLIHDIRETNPNLFVAVDHEGGFIQRLLRQGFRSLPAARVYGDVYDLNSETGIQFARKYGEIMAKDLLAYGIDLSLAPVLDVHDISPVIAHLDRAFHHDPDVVAALAGAFIEGMNAAGMPAVGKHFPGHGSVVSDSHTTMPASYASMDELKSKDLKPFIELIKMNLLSAIMPAHVTYKAVDANNPAGFSSIWLQEILRNELNYENLVISDCLSMTGADIGNLMTRAEEALKAGCDMLIICHQQRTVLLELLQTLNYVPSAESAERIRHFKSRMLCFSHAEDNQIKPLLAVTLFGQEGEKISSGKNTEYNTTKTI